jgi:glyoxylase-like metal-dependent hydrolase (beta-lactamase superfamily II)/rhodanese-related sulfurtransferase
MVRSLDVETLRTWLDDHRPVTVVDIRGAEARAEWSIPGSRHVDAPNVLKTGDPGPLATVDLPADRPVVAVCNVGRTSTAAADVLDRRGFDAWTLAGGMQAWSLAWNVADVPLAASAARVLQVRRTGKGCLSYLVGSHGDAAVVDPSVEAGVYLDLAARAGWRIRHVVDTHVHADHLTRAGAIAARTGATLWLPDTDRVHYAHERLSDGQRLTVGGTTLTAMRTPGHTPESTTILLDGAAACTGDTLFTSSIGRPDLKADAAGARERARRLFGSLRAIAALPPDTVILPGHTGEPIAFDGVPIAARLGDVMGWLRDWLGSEDAFVERVVAHLPETPPNYTRIVELNEAGEGVEHPAELEGGANRCAIGR